MQAKTCKQCSESFLVLNQRKDTAKFCSLGCRRLAESRKKVENRKTATVSQVHDLESETQRLRKELKSANQIIKSLETQLEASRETIGSLNETISLFKMTESERKPRARRTAKAT